MTMQKFIQQNRTKIDACINGALYRHDGNARLFESAFGGRGTIPNPPPKRNDEERRGWILNDEGLYLWARRAGVPV